VNKQKYLELLLQSQVLKFGSFQTKSGRQSPYFFNMGEINSGLRLATAATIYADLIAQKFPDVQNLYGPAYKGIPLAVATSEKLAIKLGRDITFTFNRKEAKAHGEGGTLVGHSYQGGEKVVVIEDVITGGTSFCDTKPVLDAVNVIGLVVGVDRQERGQLEISASAEASQLYGCPFASIVDMDWIVSFLKENQVLGQTWLDDSKIEAITKYRKTYGC